MSKWIDDDEVICHEVHGTRLESHNNLSGNPQFSVRLKIPAAQLKIAIARLLGDPQKWPHDTQFKNVVAVSASVPQLKGRYYTDGDLELVLPLDYALLDVTYIPRTGIYLHDYLDQDVYWDDTLEPRIEMFPISSPRKLVWGKVDGTLPLPANPPHLTSDEVPSVSEPGQTLIHTIEGWTDTVILDDFVGTVSTTEYISYPLRQKFEAKTLMLRSYSITKSFSFRSYRMPGPVPPPDPVFGPNEPSGIATNTLRLVYEWKPLSKGWNKFRRVNLDSSIFGWYYIHMSDSPNTIVLPFPEKSHNEFLLKP